MRLLASVLLTCLASAMDALAAPAHYIVVHEDAKGALAVTAHSVVDLAEVPRLERSPLWDGDGHRLERRLAVQVVVDGNVAFETDVVTASELRGEFHGNGVQAMRAFRKPLQERDFVIRVPAFARPGVLRVFRTGAPGRAPSQALALLEVPLSPAGFAAKAAPAGEGDVFPILTSGAPGNRLDILVIGDGYTSEQRDKFLRDAGEAGNKLLSISPYNDFRGLINVAGLHVASAESGATKPSCPETPGSPVITVNTAFKATYCTAGTRRLVTVDSSRLFAAAAAAPDWDKILVVVNDPEYGGSGGPYSVMSLHPQAYLVAQHEFAHTFTLLADEYEDAFPGYVPCSDASGSTRPCEPNVTDRLDGLKWSGWKDPATPVPTTTPLADPRAAGAWQGARYQSSGFYRQCYSGIMRNLGTPFFCRVDSAAFVARLFSGGWGSPASGVRLIEPGSVSPASAAAAVPGAVVALRATVAGSSAGVSAKWSVDGKMVAQQQLASGDVASLDYTATPGSHQIVLSVSDASGFQLIPESHATAWQVDVAPRAVASVSLSSSANPSTAGQNVTFTASTSGSGATPTGTVDFRDGSSTIAGCSAVVLSAGVARCVTQALAQGTHPISARYSGGAGYDAATSGTISQEVVDPNAPRADLGLGLSIESPAPTAGKDVTIGLAVANKGPADATDVHLTAPLPAGATLVWASPACAASSDTITCRADSIRNAGSTRFTLILRPAAAGTMAQSASVRSAQVDLASADNRASVEVAVVAAAVGKAVVRYRLYSPVTQEHLFTTDRNEYDTLGRQAGTWNQEGESGKVLDNPGSFNGVAAVPYYRLYNRQTRWHHWTTDPNEYYTLIQFPQFDAEGVDGYLLPNGVSGATPLFRLLYPDGRGLHHWTIDATEYEILIGQYGWVGEGGSGFVIR